MLKRSHLLSLLVVVFIGILARGVFFSVSPPSNSYDDHLEAVVAHRASDGSFDRAPPNACWQCYQPPLYYFISNRVIEYSPRSSSEESIWKMVQSISFVASSLSLLICTACIALLVGSYVTIRQAVLFTTIVATLPRLLFTSSMATNDALLELCVSVATFGYILTFTKPSRADLGFFIAIAGTVAAAHTKQSGLVLIVPLFAVCTMRVLGSNPMGLGARSAWFGMLGIVACALDEYFRYSQTGLFLASNQDFFTISPPQPPGTLSKVSFFSWNFGDLLRMPFMGYETLHSFWTEIYGRLWFDYERRFFNTDEATLRIGAIIYLLAIPVSAYVITSVFLAAEKLGRRPMVLLLALIGVGYVAVPILQTIRLPFYSSMKAVFLTAGITPLMCLASIGSSRLNPLLDRYRADIWLTISVTAICVFTLWLLLATSSQAWREGVSGPLWPLPQIAR